MDQLTVQERVIRAIQPYSQTTLTPESVLSDAGMQSLDVVCALHAIEEEFDVPMNLNLQMVTTVQDLVQAVCCAT